MFLKVVKLIPMVSESGIWAESDNAYEKIYVDILYPFSPERSMLKEFT
jgi:hypothetical protein